MRKKEGKFAVIIAGPTAVGKTALSIAIAKKLGAEIISADSRQVYQELSIGTAKPTSEELRQVQHHLVDMLPLTTTYSAGQFERDALQVANHLFKKDNFVVVSGGSGMYVKGFAEGFDEMPHVPNSIREDLNRELKTKGIEVLQNELEQADPEYYKQVDIANKQRVVRALEVCRATGKPFSAFRNKEPINKRSFQLIKIGLERGREELYNRINHRMDIMLKEGLLEEAKMAYPYRELNALQTVGYQEIFDFIEGKYDWEECVRLLKRNSRRYAKRQMTWFKRDEEFTWFHPEEEGKIMDYIYSCTQ